MTVRSTANPEPIVIEVWTDLGCPWCYIGKHRLASAIAERPDAARFDIRLRSFELNPGAPTTPETIEQAFMRSHGGDVDDVVRAERRIQALAEREGLEFSLQRLNANTFDVHRVLHLAEAHGVGLEFFGRLQDRFFAGEINPFDADVLAGVAAEVGVPVERVGEVLRSDELADVVRADRAEAGALGATGVPFVVFAGQYAAPGAQSVEVYRRILDEVAATAVS